MQEIAKLEHRITAALDRIREGVEGQGDVADLRRRLDRQTRTNEELIRSARALKDDQDAEIAGLSARVESQRETIAQLDSELQRLRASNKALRDGIAELRAGLGEPDTTSAELEALRAERAAEAAEVQAILAELAPLLEEEREVVHAAG